MCWALGLIPQEISIRLRVPLVEVLKVGEAMDAAARETDHARNDRCVKGLHPMTPANTYRNRRGGACCRACKRIANNASTARRSKGKAA